ncbi:MAG: hypothetical protein JNM28_01485 [Armatimonadetes bacterium]|nr:hypothetical protein [Armatimonadota bacterium]
MKVIACVLAIGSATAAQAGEVVMDVVAGNLKGSATLVNKVLPDGSKYVRLGMLLKESAGREVSVLQESTYDKEGKPVRMLQRTSLKGNSATQSIVVTFDESGANVKVDQGGKTVNDLVAYPSGKSIAALPEFWFIRDQVASGGQRNYSRFDIGSQTWKEINCTYLGTREVTWAGKTVKAHYVTMGDAKAYLDESGDPYVVETPNGKMTRRAK